MKDGPNLPDLGPYELHDLRGRIVCHDLIESGRRENGQAKLHRPRNLSHFSSQEKIDNSVSGRSRKESGVFGRKVLRVRDSHLLDGHIGSLQAGVRVRMGQPVVVRDGVKNLQLILEQSGMHGKIIQEKVRPQILLGFLERLDGSGKLV